MGESSVCSAALPMGTCPRLLMLPSNFFCLLRMFRGAGCLFTFSVVVLFVSCFPRLFGNKEIIIEGQVRKTMVNIEMDEMKDSRWN